MSFSRRQQPSTFGSDDVRHLGAAFLAAALMVLSGAIRAAP